MERGVDRADGVVSVMDVGDDQDRGEVATASPTRHIASLTITRSVRNSHLGSVLY